MRLILNTHLFIAFLLSAYFIHSQDYSSSNLAAVYGKKFYTGNKDCSSTVKVSSKNNQIVIHVSVKDDAIVLKDDIMESDHIEVWFNMDTLYNDYFVYQNKFYGGDSITKDKKNNFIEYLQGTLALNEDQNTKIDPSAIPIVKEINGMVHYGFDLKTNMPSLFDQEFYLKLPISDSVKTKVTCKKELVKGGYNVTITFQPEALVFFRNNIVNQLIFMVDVFDVDQTSKDLSVLSTAPHRRWGAPETFTKTHLKNPIKVTEDLNPFKIEFPFSFYFYKNNKWHYYYRSDEKMNWFDPYFLYSFKELIPKKSTISLVDTMKATLYSYDVEPYKGYKGKINRIKYKKEVFGYDSYGCNEAKYLIKKINDRDLAISTTSCYIKSPWGSGECGACLFKDKAYYILKDNKLYPILLFTYSDDGQRILLPNDYKNADLISSGWSDNLSSLILELKEYDYSKENTTDKCYRYNYKWDLNFKPIKEIKEINCPSKK